MRLANSKTMNTLQNTLSISAGAMLLLACHTGQASDLAYAAIPAADLGQLKIAPGGKIIAAKTIRDSLGEHVLVLTEKSTASSNGRIEKIDLAASYYDKTADKWALAWTVKDGVDCPNLDSAASFFADATSITDLDKDGNAEVTVAYKTFCGGGIDPSTIKVIMRQGKEKFAIRGESLIKFKGQEPMGGTNTPDKALLANSKAVFKRHMDKIWKRIYVERNE